MFSLLLKDLTFVKKKKIFVVTTAGVVLCGGPKGSPRLKSSLYFVFDPLRSAEEKSENIMSKLRAPFGFISVFRLTALLKLEITVCFLWLSLPVH